MGDAMIPGVTVTARQLGHARGDQVWEIRDHGVVIAERFTFVTPAEADEIVLCHRAVEAVLMTDIKSKPRKGAR